MSPTKALSLLRETHTSLSKDAPPEEVVRSINNKIRSSRVRHGALSDLKDQMDNILAAGNAETIRKIAS